jgi:hypothetical protein
MQNGSPFANVEIVEREDEVVVVDDAVLEIVVVDGVIVRLPMSMQEATSAKEAPW